MVGLLGKKYSSKNRSDRDWNGVCEYATPEITMSKKSIRTIPLYNERVTVLEQIEYLKKGMVEIIREEDLKDRLEQCAKAGRPLRVKAGFDPTAPDLHIGHKMCIRDRCWRRPPPGSGL